MPPHSHDWVEIDRGNRIGPGGGSNPFVIEQCSICGQVRDRGI